MVLFKCKTCAASVMQRDVGKHVGKCSGPLALTCVDCKKDFHGQQHETHTSCFGPRVAEVPKVSMESKTNKNAKKTARKKIINKKNANKKNATKQFNIEALNHIPIDASDPALQQQWKEAALLASKDPSFTSDQKFLLEFTSKQSLPKKISHNIIKKFLRSCNSRLIQKFRRTEFAAELLRMVALELKNVNGPQKKDPGSADEGLTQNQRLIHEVLVASEAPGLKPEQRSLLASLAQDKDSQQYGKELMDYAFTVWRITDKRVDAMLEQAFRRFELEFFKLRNEGKEAGGTNGSATEGNPASEIDVGTASPKAKKEKHKKGKDLDKSKENGIDAVRETEEDVVSKKSKKRKHKRNEEDGEVVKNEDEGGEKLGDAAEDATTKKNKKKSKGREEACEDQVTEGFCNRDGLENTASKKSKKHKRRSDSAAEEMSESKENEDLSNGIAVEFLGETARSGGKKKKSKRQEEATADEEVPRKKSK